MSSQSKFYIFKILCASADVTTWEVRDRATCPFWGLNSGCWAWCQDPADPSFWFTVKIHTSVLFTAYEKEDVGDFETPEARHFSNSLGKAASLGRYAKSLSQRIKYILLIGENSMLIGSEKS